MRRLPLWKIILLLGFSFMLVYLYSWISSNDVKVKTNAYSPQNTASSKLITLSPEGNNKAKTINRIVLSFVVCDSRFNESLNVVKSVLLFTKTPVHFVIFTDNNLKSKFNDTLSKWRTLTDNQLDFELHNINFPEEHVDDWMNLFSKCAAQRLFIPKLISHIDAMIYVDTDTLFLGPADELWHKFSLFNISQISAMALENDNPNVSWYPRFAKHPFYGKYGLNSGVMLMNLTRMRDFGWVDYVTPIMLKWKLYIPWGDQDIINVIFHYHPRAVLELSCRYNYRTDQCVYGDACADAAAGVFLLHGSRKAFHTHKQPAFEVCTESIGQPHKTDMDIAGVINLLSADSTENRHRDIVTSNNIVDLSENPLITLDPVETHQSAVYRAISEWQVGSAPRAAVAALVRYLEEAPPSACGNLKDAFLKVPAATIQRLYGKPDR